MNLSTLHILINTLNIGSKKYKRKVLINLFNPTTFLWLSQTRSRFPMPCVVVFYVFNSLIWEVVVCLIGDIVYHHGSNFLFILFHLTQSVWSQVTFLPIANRSTALSYCPFSRKKSPHLCNNSGSALSSNSPEINCKAPNCLALNDKSKALEKFPAYKMFIWLEMISKKLFEWLIKTIINSFIHFHIFCHNNI